MQNDAPDKIWIEDAFPLRHFTDVLEKLRCKIPLYETYILLKISGRKHVTQRFDPYLVQCFIITKGAVEFTHIDIFPSSFEVGHKTSSMQCAVIIILSRFSAIRSSTNVVALTVNYIKPDLIMEMSVEAPIIDEKYCKMYHPQLNYDKVQHYMNRSSTIAPIYINLLNLLSHFIRWIFFITCFH